MGTPFVWTASYPPGQQFNVVKARTQETIKPSAHVPTGVVDSKGRVVTYRTGTTRVVIELAEQDPGCTYFTLHRVGAPTDYYVGTAQQCRGGRAFGGSSITVRGTDLAEVTAELDRRVAAAIAAAQRKHLGR